MADISASIALDEQPISYLCRGEFFCRPGRYDTALEDFDWAEQFDPEDWLDLLGTLYQADCYSRLGNTPPALSACA